MLGHMTVSPGVTGYTVTAGNVTVNWDGQDGCVVRVPCGVDTEGLLGPASCQEDGQGTFY